MLLNKNKILTAILTTLVAIPFSTQGQQPQIDFQKIIQVQSCIAKLDQQALRQFGEEAGAMQSELKSMCRAGQRDEAQAAAISFAIDMFQNETLQQAKQCGDMVKHMLPPLNFPTSPEDLKGRHICDEI